MSDPTTTSKAPNDNNAPSPSHDGIIPLRRGARKVSKVDSSMSNEMAQKLLAEQQALSQDIQISIEPSAVSSNTTSPNTKEQFKFPSPLSGGPHRVVSTGAVPSKTAATNGQRRATTRINSTMEHHHNYDINNSHNNGSPPNYSLSGSAPTTTTSSWQQSSSSISSSNRPYSKSSQRSNENKSDNAPLRSSSPPAPTKLMATVSLDRFSPPRERKVSNVSSNITSEMAKQLLAEQQAMSNGFGLSAADPPPTEPKPISPNSAPKVVPPLRGGRQRVASTGEVPSKRDIQTVRKLSMEHTGTRTPDYSLSGSGTANVNNGQQNQAYTISPKSNKNTWQNSDDSSQTPPQPPTKFLTTVSADKVSPLREPRQVSNIGASITSEMAQQLLAEQQAMSNDFGLLADPTEKEEQFMGSSVQQHEPPQPPPPPPPVESSYVDVKTPKMAASLRDRQRAVSMGHNVSTNSNLDQRRARKLSLDNSGRSSNYNSGFKNTTTSNKKNNNNNIDGQVGAFSVSNQRQSSSSSSPYNQMNSRLNSRMARKLPTGSGHSQGFHSHSSVDSSIDGRVGAFSITHEPREDSSPLQAARQKVNALRSQHENGTCPEDFQQQQPPSSSPRNTTRSYVSSVDGGAQPEFVQEFDDDSTTASFSIGSKPKSSQIPTSIRAFTSSRDDEDAISVGSMEINPSRPNSNRFADDRRAARRAAKEAEQCQDSRIPDSGRIAPSVRSYVSSDDEDALTVGSMEINPKRPTSNRLAEDRRAARRAAKEAEQSQSLESSMHGGTLTVGSRSIISRAEERRRVRKIRSMTGGSDDDDTLTVGSTDNNLTRPASIRHSDGRRAARRAAKEASNSVTPSSGSRHASVTRDPLTTDSFTRDSDELEPDPEDFVNNNNDNNNLSSVQESPREDTDKQNSNKRVYIAYCVALVVIICAVVVVVVVLISGKGDNPVGDQNPSDDNNMMMISESEQKFNEMKQMIISNGWSSMEAFDNDDSPQSLAVTWLAENDAIKSSDDDSIELSLYTLTVLYYALNGPSWTASSVWLDNLDGSIDVCTWDYISCDSRGDVSKLDLPELLNSFDATLPQELFLLTSLNYLSISLNGLVAIQEPPTERIFPKLEKLYLYDNDFGAEFPDWFYQLTNLIHLEVPDSNFEGTLSTEIGNLSQLTTLSVVANFLTGDVPTQIGLLTNLKILDLSINSFKTTLPTEIGNLIELNILGLGGTPFKGEMPMEILNLLQLKELSLGGDLGASLWPFLGALSSLSKIFMGFVPKPVGTIPTIFGNLFALTSLQLQDVNLTGPLPSQIGKLGALRDLFFTGIALTGTLPTEIGDLTNLARWDFSGAKLNGPIPSEIGRMTSLEQVVLGFDSGDLSPLPSEIGELDMLQRLDISPAFAPVTVPPEICDLPNMESFCVDRTELHCGFLCQVNKPIKPTFDF